MSFNTNSFVKDTVLSVERMRLKIRILTLADLLGSGVISEQDHNAWASYYNRKFIQKYDEVSITDTKKPQ